MFNGKWLILLALAGCIAVNADKQKIEQMPMSKSLRVGETYLFRFRPAEGTNWALINNKTWYRN